MKVGDTAQLKTPQQGRRFKGRVGRIYNNMVRINLPNGLYVEYPEDLLEIVEEGNEAKDE